MTDITLGTIYEDVAELQSQVAELQSITAEMQNNLATFSTQMIAENTDLNSLSVGKYIIPSAAICGTLLNKPVTSNATGFINVVSGGSAGQLMMYYFPCSKEGASYYQRAYYESSWGNWHDIDVFDSGWIDLTLSSSVIAFNDEQKPRYRRVGNEVFITGVVKNISSNETTIATLPTNYRPSKKLIISVPSTGTNFSRISILTTGAINYEQIISGTPTASQWHSVACSFHVD